jgi:hypothetical protein
MFVREFVATYRFQEGHLWRPKVLATSTIKAKETMVFSRYRIARITGFHNIKYCLW